MVGHYVQHHADALVLSHVVTITGTGVLLSVSTSHSMLVIGIAIAMHGVATYAHTYMGFEQYSMSFTIELLLFMGCMLSYVLAVSLLLVVVLWEYLGLLSYVLIQHWGSRSLATLSSAKSLTYNKLLDTIVLCTSTTLWLLGIGDVSLVLSAGVGSMLDMLVLSMVSIKSVTIGVHSWLPDAMEGPTSVSAVIHAATLVVAGALLVCKVAIQL